MTHASTASSITHARRGGHLFVVDLASSEIARPLLTRAAQASITDAGSNAVVLIAGDSATIRIPAGATLVSFGDVLRDDTLAAAHQWVDIAARDVAFGAGRDLFPTVSGIHFGEYALLDIQSALADFALLAAAMAALLVSTRMERCSIFTADRQRSQALADLAAGTCPAVSVFSVPFMSTVRRAIDFARAVRGVSSPPSSANERLAVLAATPPARVLVTSESLPMAQMFAPVEARLRELAVGPVTRVQFDAPPRVERHGSTAVAHIGHDVIGTPRLRRRFARLWRRVAPLARALRISAPMGAAGAHLRAPVFATLQHMYGAHFDLLAEQLDLANAILDHVRPELLVVGNDRWWVEHAFVLLARQRGIPSLLVLDGITSDRAEWWWVSADRVAASGEAWAEQLRRHGVPAGRIAVTGQPRYDELAGRRGNLAKLAGARGDVGLRPQDFAVLLALQSGHSPIIITEAIESILRVPGSRVLMRPKPGIAVDLDVLVARFGDRVLPCGRQSIASLLDAADLVVTESSTVGLEAAILGIPLLTFTFGGGMPLVSYRDLGLAEHATSPDDLTAAVSLVRGRGRGSGRIPAARWRAVEHLCGPVDGCAAQRVAALVAEMLGSHRSRAVPGSSAVATTMQPSGELSLRGNSGKGAEERGVAPTHCQASSCTLPNDMSHPARLLRLATRPSGNRSGQ